MSEAIGDSSHTNRQSDLGEIEIYLTNIEWKIFLLRQRVRKNLDSFENRISKKIVGLLSMEKYFNDDVRQIQKWNAIS